MQKMNSTPRKKCLITGGTGFVGRKLFDSLKEKNLELVLLLRKKSAKLDVKQYQCDFGNDDIPEDALSGIDTIYHLAGFAHDSRDANKIETLYKAVNVDATLKLANLAVKHGVKKFVFISSVKAGGSSVAGVCANESDLGAPEGIYGQTKREAEVELLKIGKASRMEVSILRPSLVYGPGVKGNLRMMLKGISKGWFPPLPETFNQRSMVHLNDLVDAIQLAAEKDEANGEIFIVTDGKLHSSCEIYKEMCMAVGRVVPNWYVPKYMFVFLASLGDVLGHFVRFPFDSYRLKKLLGDDCYSSNKIRKNLGFQSKISLKDALPEMIKKNSIY
jgi:nucleoside-diphosphate-sugar epimerase